MSRTLFRKNVCNIFSVTIYCSRLTNGDTPIKLFKSIWTIYTKNKITGSYLSVIFQWILTLSPVRSFTVAQSERTTIVL